MEAIFEFFTLERVLGTKTFYKDINFLPPATVLLYQGSNFSLTSYWRRKYRDEKYPKKYYVDNLSITIKKSLERRMQGNYRFGLLLSGGLDSRMVLAASDKELVCFTFGDFENREVKIAKRIANVKGYKHIFLKRDMDHYTNLIDEAVEIGDGMYGFFHAHCIGFFDEIRKECDVLFHGFVPELFFRGTNLPHRSLNVFGKNFFTVLAKLSNENLPYKIIDKLKYSVYQRNPSQLFVQSYVSVLDAVLLDSVNTILKEAERSCTNIYDKFIWPDIYYHSRYPSFLFEMSIRSFIDERSFMFDNDLLNLHLQMSASLRSNNRVWKEALSKLNSKIAKVPNANTGYSPVMPEILERGLNFIKTTTSILHMLRPDPLPHPLYTQGSWPNWSELIRYNEKMKKMMYTSLSDPEYLDPKIFNIKRIEKMFKEYLSGKNEFAIFLFLLMTFGKWYKQYGPK
jgi:asparagine synthase (glutamine-hydrolysing)